MGLLDDFSRREAKAEPKPEPPAVGHYGVKLDLKEEKVSLTAGQTKEYPVVVTNTGTEDDTIRIKVDLVYNSELPDPLILGWRGGWRRGRILGTNVDRFVQEAPCDVVVFKSAGLKPKVERILVMNAPEWHVSYATGYAILLAKKHRAKITILSAVQTDRELEKERGYSARLAEMCRTHSVAFEEKFVKARNIVDAVVEEAKNY